MVKAGKHQNASEAMRDAVRGSQRRCEEDALKLKALRKLIREGAAALRRGEFDEVDDAGLDVYLDALAAPAKTVSRGAASAVPAGSQRNREAGRRPT